MYKVAAWLIGVALIGWVTFRNITKAIDRAVQGMRA